MGDKGNSPPPQQITIEAPAPAQYTKPTQQQYAAQEIAESQWDIYKSKFRPAEIEFLKNSKEQNLEPYGITRGSAEVMQRTALNPETTAMGSGLGGEIMARTSTGIGAGLAAGNSQAVLNEEKRAITTQLDLLKAGSGLAIGTGQTATQGAGASVGAAIGGLNSQLNANLQQQQNARDAQSRANQEDADDAAALGGLVGFGLSFL
jgi:hypothetical protein